jgi:hypothetical protein
MRTLICNRTHHGDPDRRLSGRVRNGNFDAMLEVRGFGAEPAAQAIAASARVAPRENTGAAAGPHASHAIVAHSLFRLVRRFCTMPPCGME